MRSLMDRLDVLESRQHQTLAHPQSSLPQAAVSAGTESIKEERSRKRKRMISTPTTVSSSSSSVAEVRGRTYHPPDRKDTSRRLDKSHVDAADEEGEDEDVEEEEDEKEGESSEEEPLVRHQRQGLSMSTLSSRTNPADQDQTTLPSPQGILYQLDHHPRTKHGSYEPGHAVSQPIGLARILNPTTSATMNTISTPAKLTTPVLKNRLPLIMDSLVALNSPTPSRTDSEATVLEENLPEGGSDSGLDFSLGLVDGIAVRTGEFLTPPLTYLHRSHGGVADPGYGMVYRPDADREDGGSGHGGSTDPYFFPRSGASSSVPKKPFVFFPFCFPRIGLWFLRARCCSGGGDDDDGRAREEQERSLPLEPYRIISPLAFHHRDLFFVYFFGVSFRCQPEFDPDVGSGRNVQKRADGLARA